MRERLGWEGWNRKREREDEDERERERNIQTYPMDLEEEYKCEWGMKKRDFGRGSTFQAEAAVGKTRLLRGLFDFVRSEKSVQYIPSVSREVGHFGNSEWSVS